MKLRPPVKSIGFTCDFLRARFEGHGFVNFQLRNLAWLENVIGAKSKWQRWGVKTSVVSVPSETEEFRRALGNDVLFSEYLNDSDQTWASLYDMEEGSNAFASIFEELCQHDLVVGFELPPSLKRAIHRAGKTYVSFYIHPVRFLRDLCFLITTNSNDIADMIAECAVSSHEIDFQARRFSALFSRLRLSALSLPDDVPVVIGQTDKDSVLVRNGRFASWENYEEELAKTLSSHSELIFLEHPYRPNGSSVAEYFRSSLGKTVISVQANSYGVVFSPTKVPFFLTLASSLGVEAQCAGRDCTFLLNDPREKFLVEGIDIPDTRIVSHAVLRDSFWQQIIFGGQKDRKVEDVPSIDDFFLGEHYIRNSLDSWAFRALQSGLSLGPVRKTIIPAAPLMPDRLQTLTNILCDAASEAASAVEDGIRIQMHWGCVDTLRKPLRVGTSSAVDLTQPAASHYLAEGFHAPESWGVWSSSKYSRIVLPVDLEGATEAELCITMTLKIFSGIVANAPVLQVVMNGKGIGFVFFRASSKGEREISFSGRIRESLCEIEFHISHTGRPALISQSTDSRDLGFGLSALNVALSPVKESTAQEGGGQYAQKFWGVPGEDMTEPASGEASLHLLS